MSNSFYNHGAFPSTGSAATSASMRAELDLISAAFDKMPTLSGNANKFIVVNSTGTGLTQTDVLPAFTVTDTDFTIQDNGDNTRKFQFDAGAITTGNTRIFAVPNANTTLVGTDVAQTLTNKTLTAPVIATIVNTGTLTLPTSTDTLVGRATTDTLTNKTLTAPVIATISNTGTLTLPTSTDTLVGRATTDTLTNKSMSGSNNTFTNIANSSLTNSSVTIGSSSLSLGGTLTTLAGVTISGASNTLSNIANASLTNSSITVNSTAIALGGSATITAVNPNAITVGTGLQLNTGTTYDGSAARTISIDSTVATLSGSQTLSNKTISGSSNTLSNIANSSLTNSSITIGSSSISLGSTASSISGLTSLSSTGLVMTANAASSTAISAIAQSAGTVTVTAAGHGLTSGDLVSIDGVADYTYCGLVTVNVTNANVFTYSAVTTNSSSSGGYVTKLQGTWASYSGGTGPSYSAGPVTINASSQMPALRVTQGGNGYAFIVEDATNPDTSAFIISNAGDLAINTNKFTVASATGNTVIAGTTSLGGNVTFATDATYDIGASGANRPRDMYLSRNLTVGGTLTLAGGVNLNGNVTIGDASTDTLTVNSTITSNLIFTDNTYDIGASGATRPRNIYVGTSVVTGADSTIYGITVGRGAGAVASNTVVGASALAANTTGLANDSFGYQSLTSNTTGNENVGLAYQTLFANTTGAQNTAVGSAAVRSNTTGNYNTGVGYRALYSNTTASNNTAVGYQAGYSQTLGSANTFIGHQAGYSTNYTAGISNTANTFVGWKSGYAVTTGYNNTILGSYSGNQGGLDIRTASNYIVLSDGDGNPRVLSDNQGNVGVGTIPSSSWNTNGRVLEWGNSTYHAATFQNGDDDLWFTSNAYFDGSNWKAYRTSTASFFHLGSKGFYFQGADSVSAGANLTPVTLLNVEKGKTVALEGGTQTAGVGIAFPGTQVASSNANTLDDYEEGTWTPNQGSGLTVVGAFSSVGYYTKIGNTVTIWGYVKGATSVSCVAAGIICSNAPFSGSVGGIFWTGSTIDWNATSGGSCAVQQNTTNIYSGTAVTASDRLSFSITYQV